MAPGDVLGRPGAPGDVVRVEIEGLGAAEMHFPDD